MIRGPWPMTADKTRYEVPLQAPYLTPMFCWMGALPWVRVALRVSAADAAKPQRGPGVYGTITDLDTGERYLIQGRPCEIPDCYCDAEIVEVTTTG